MKALIGIDVQGHSAAALDLFRRLNFASEKVWLLHSVESIMPDGSFPGFISGGQVNDMIEEFEKAGRNALDEAKTRLPGVEVETKLAVGDPLQGLLDLADENGIDLISVGTQRKGALQAMIMGSVTRGLLTASTHSFLAAKSNFRTEGPLTAVIATDHSDYANRCMELLVRFAPRGLGKIVILTVIDPKAQRAAAQFGGDPEMSNAGMWAEDRMSRENQALARRLEPVCSVWEERVESGEINGAIRRVMQEVGADLLIMGAHGHGFLERLRSGSVSFHQVVAEDYSVLVLRA